MMKAHCLTGDFLMVPNRSKQGKEGTRMMGMQDKYGASYLAHESLWKQVRSENKT